ncbi:hypothetical protein Glove_139g363 [Diversispora epigaea]|uniref:Uncharacterized protein n=1 Tax=Diversispora epigaea TaxID=1348612 RepID=A0A397IVC5_9GLOM|nr:hypothetical protein Glove_139g363 [Diversispora epigaea]
MFQAINHNPNKKISEDSHNHHLYYSPKKKVRKQPQTLAPPKTSVSPKALVPYKTSYLTSFRKIILRNTIHPKISPMKENLYGTALPSSSGGNGANDIISKCEYKKPEARTKAYHTKGNEYDANCSKKNQEPTVMSVITSQLNLETKLYGIHDIAHETFHLGKFREMNIARRCFHDGPFFLQEFKQPCKQPEECEVKEIFHTSKRRYVEIVESSSIIMINARNPNLVTEVHVLYIMFFELTKRDEILNLECGKE